MTPTKTSLPKSKAESGDSWGSFVRTFRERRYRPPNFGRYFYQKVLDTSQPSFRITNPAANGRTVPSPRERFQPRLVCICHDCGCQILPNAESRTDGMSWDEPPSRDRIGAPLFTTTNKDYLPALISVASDSGTTATSPPFSPFSPATSVASDNTGTSDEPADLGAFTSVFRALSQLQVSHPRTTTSLATIPAVEEDDDDDTDRFNSDSDSSDVVTPNRARDSDSDRGVYAYDVESAVEAEDSRPVWNHEPIASYLVSAATPAPAQQMARLGSGTYVDAPTLSMAHEALLSQTLAQTFVPEPYQHVPRTPGPGDPTLGALEQALGFLAAERTRVASQLDSSIEAEYAYRTEGKRRRRKRKKGVRDEEPPNPLLNHSTSSLQLAKAARGSNSGSAHERTDTAVPSPSEGTSFSSSSADPKVRRAYMEHPPPVPRVNPNMLAHEIIASYSVPTPPPGRRPSRRGRSFDARPVVNHQERASYDPRLQRLSSGSGSSPTGVVQTGESKVARLRLLANNLARRFPQDAGALRRAAEGGGGGAVERQQSLLYVFVDHSNILVGFLEYIKKHPHLLPPSTGSPRRIKPKILHTALVLLLERGRPCARRILVASSPLHQTLDGVVGMGYEVSVLQRVEIKEGDEGRDGYARPGNGNDYARQPGNDYSRQPGNDLRQLPNDPFPRREIGSSEDDRRRHRRTPSDAPRTRYREEAVDELLQLKLLQTILDTPPATIVLATGDGASSQFNPDGFVGCVRRAIERGWNVELVAWEEGVSRAWRELEREGGGRFRVVGLEGWVGELVDF